MNRIEKVFKESRRSGRKVLVGYLTAGDPDIRRSEKSIRIALESGLDILELGVPFSDPTADGPIIQEASHRALAAGMNLRAALDMVSRLRRDFDQPVVLFGYANPFFRYGYEALCRDSRRAGVDGFLVVDLPAEERREMDRFVVKNGQVSIPLVAPTTPPARAREILKGAGGFVYYIMVKGVTGLRAAVGPGVGARVRALRRCTDLPIVAGFGVSNGAQARAAARLADGVVVGSALVQAAGRNRLGRLVRELRTALD